MKTTDILSLIGGLALFLYGMQMMSGGLEAAAGNKMKTILEKLTSNRFVAVLVGAVITMVIQSSSATTVMVVGFVSAGLMNLGQAVWIIMGANIGTTITGQLIALDVGEIAPIMAMIGVAMIVFMKGEKQHHIGSIIAGIGVLFIGMGMMSDAMRPLRDMPQFAEFVQKFNHPLLGILIGAVFTAIIQSSSASVGILQALATSGVVGLHQSAFILFGQNIGTCITAVLASIGTKAEAKRATAIHLMFNIFGTIVFSVICLVTPFISWVEQLTPGNVMSQIANTHTIFNIATTLILLPFGTLMAKLATKLIHESQEEKEERQHLEFLEPFDTRKTHQVGQISVSISQISQETARMFSKVRKNVEASFDAVIHGDVDAMEKIANREEYIDYLNAEISKYIGKVIVLDMSAEDSKCLNGYFSIIGNMERIGDHAMNFAEYTVNLHKRNLEFSEFAKEELQRMKEVTLETLDYLSNWEHVSGVKLLESVSRREQKIDDMTESFREQQVDRMQNGLCNPETGILFSEMLTDFERIGDHALNIAQLYQKIRA